MMKTITELGRIYKALSSSYEILEQEAVREKHALESLKEAEERLNSAIKYMLLQNRRRA